LTQLRNHYEENLRKNICFIEINFPDTARALKAVHTPPDFEKTKSGSLTLKIREIYVESRYDPQKRAGIVTESIDSRADHAVFLSSGLGYHINEFLRNSSASCTVIEKDAALFRAALHVIEHQYISRITPVIDAEVESVCAALTVVLSNRVAVYRHPRGASLYSSFYEEIEEFIRARLKERVASAVTERVMQKLWLKNILRNVSRLHNGYSGTERCAGAFKGAALLVASGPFLEDIAGDLQRLGKKIPLIALLPSLPYLQKLGVVPDAVLTTDAGFGNIYRMVRGVHVPLVAAFSTAPAVLQHWKGPVHLFSHGLPFEKNLTAVHTKSMLLPMQGTSAAVLIGLARIMGFRPLFLGGYDYAYRGIKDHHEGAGFDSQFLSTQTRLANWQTEVVRRWRKDRPVRLVSTGNTPVISTHKLMLYREWIEKEIASSDLYRLNHGLPIRKIPYIQAHEVLSGKKGGGRKDAGFKDTVLGNPISPRALAIDMRRAASVIDKIAHDDENAMGLLYGFFYGKSAAGQPEKEVREDVGFAIREFERCFSRLREFDSEMK
jgi:hypothetical protein